MKEKKKTLMRVLNLLTFCIVFSLIAENSYAQNENLNQQIVVMFKIKSIELPKNTIETTVDKIKTTESIKKILTTDNTLSIKKGWPEFERKDTLKY